MKKLSENVINVLDNQPLWYVGTCSDEPNTVVIGFKEILNDGRLLLCDVFMKQTLINLLENGKISIAVCNPDTMEGYQIKGKAVYLSDGVLLESWKESVSAFSGGKLVPKGVVLVSPESVKVISPNSHNGDEL